MLRLNTRDPGFEAAFRKLVADRRESDENVARDVQIILDDVKKRGEAVLIELTRNDPELQLEFIQSLQKDAGRLAADPGAND
mgnify:CR=1 FL=1